MAELGVQPPTSLYPQPPQQQGALSGNPTQMLDLIGAITRNQMLQNELKSRTAVGQAYQGALNPDGSIDPQKFTAAVRGNTDASWNLGETLQGMNNVLRGQFESRYAPDQAVRSVMSSLPRNATDEQLRSYSAALVRAGVPAVIAEGHRNALMGLQGKARANAIDVMQSTALPPGQGAGLVAAPPLPGGVPAQQTTKERLLGGGGGGGPQAIGQPTGEDVVQGGAAETAKALESTGATTSQYHADLENLKQDSKIMDNLGGPTVEVEKKLNQLSHRLAGFGVTMNADQLRALESFDKIAQSISQRQASLFHGSDASLYASVASNPNSGMSRYGREGVIDMLQGNQDALDRQRKLWLDARRRGTPANSYHFFADEASKVIDPRVFQFNRMSRENQQKFLSDMDPSDLSDFEAKYQDAIKRKWVNPLKGQKQSALETPPMAGARQGRDASGNPGWFVPDPDRPGKHLQYMMG